METLTPMVLMETRWLFKVIWEGKKYVRLKASAPSATIHSVMSGNELGKSSKNFVVGFTWKRQRCVKLQKCDVIVVCFRVILLMTDDFFNFVAVTKAHFMQAYVAGVHGPHWWFGEPAIWSWIFVFNVFPFIQNIMDLHRPNMVKTQTKISYTIFQQNPNVN